MRNGIKERFDVQIDDPVGRPASLPRHSHRVERRLAGAIAVRVRMELRFHQRLQDHLHHGLRHAIRHGRNAQRARAAVVLRDLDEPHGRRKVRARRHPIPDLVEIALQVLLERRQRLAIHARSSSVRLHPLIRFPHELLRNLHKAWPQTSAPPLAGWPIPSARMSGPFAPPALPGFVATTSPSVPSPRIGTLILVGPPLGFLPSHRGEGSHVPHTSLRWAHAVSMPVTARTVSRLPPSFVPGQTASLVSMTSQRFRHVINGSLTFVFPART